jgi:hypothetical protein
MPKHELIDSTTIYGRSAESPAIRRPAAGLKSAQRSRWRRQQRFGAATRAADTTQETEKAMTRLITALVAAPLAVAVPTMAHAQRLPDYDSKLICKAIVEQKLEESNEVCLQKEKAAYETLRARWQRYPARRRAQCVRDGSIAMMGASYDNLLWCLKQK